MALEEKLLLTPDEVAERLSIGRSHVYALLAGDPPPLRSIKLGKCRRIPVAELARFLAARLADLDSPAPGA